jgi:hypothetical protein
VSGHFHSYPILAAEYREQDRAHGQCDFCGDTLGDDDESDELTSASNAIVDMVHDGKLDEAEQAAGDFLVRFPEVHEGYDRLGMVYEARGDHKQAAHYYRQVIDFVRAHPDHYEPAFETTFQRLVQKLDPPPANRRSDGFPRRFSCAPSSSATPAGKSMLDKHAIKVREIALLKSHHCGTRCQMECATVPLPDALAGTE